MYAVPPGLCDLNGLALNTLVSVSCQDEYSILPYSFIIGVHGYVLVYSVTSLHRYVTKILSGAWKDSTITLELRL